MPKYYIKSGTLELIFSTNKKPLEAACAALWETNKNDTIDEFFYIDERGMRDYVSADNNTKVIPSEKVIKKARWSIDK